MDDTAAALESAQRPGSGGVPPYTRVAVDEQGHGRPGPSVIQGWEDEDGALLVGCQPCGGYHAYPTEGLHSPPCGVVGPDSTETSYFVSPWGPATDAIRAARL
jgi:hypothetical protein